MKDEIQDEFLSEEDLDLRDLSEEELIAYWNLWLHQAQASNDLDRDLYSHGVFEREPRRGHAKAQRRREEAEEGKQDSNRNPVG